VTTAVRKYVVPLVTALAVAAPVLPASAASLYTSFSFSTTGGSKRLPDFSVGRDGTYYTQADVAGTTCLASYEWALRKNSFFSPDTTVQTGGGLQCDPAKTFPQKALKTGAHHYDFSFGRSGVSAWVKMWYVG